MTLSELKKVVDAAVERAGDFGVSPDKIPVTLQIDFMGSEESVWSSDEQRITILSTRVNRL